METPCLQCQAEQYLTVGDFLVLEFYQQVRDQVFNWTPLGTEDGKWTLVPRLEAWVLVAQLMSIPEGVWWSLIGHARAIHAATEGRLSLRAVFDMDYEDMAPLDEDDDG